MKEGAEKKYRMFITYSSKSVCADYSAVMRNENHEGAHRCGDRETGALESIIMYLTGLDP